MTDQPPNESAHQEVQPPTDTTAADTSAAAASSASPSRPLLGDLARSAVPSLDVAQAARRTMAVAGSSGATNSGTSSTSHSSRGGHHHPKSSSSSSSRRHHAPASVVAPVGPAAGHGRGGAGGGLPAPVGRCCRGSSVLGSGGPDSGRCQHRWSAAATAAAAVIVVERQRHTAAQPPAQGSLGRRHWDGIGRRGAAAQQLVFCGRQRRRRARGDVPKLAQSVRSQQQQQQ